MQIKAATYEPKTPEERIRGISVLLPLEDREGFIFLIAYTKKEQADAELLLQGLMDQTRRLANSFGKDANPQHRFEQFLGALNETLAQQVRDGRWHVPIDQLHALIGIGSSTYMYLSGTGELTALFLHKKPSQRYQIFNLFRSLQTEQSLPTWEKTFAVVLDGDLHPGDVFCASDKDLQRCIPAEELNHILTSLPPVGAVEKIRQYFGHKDGILLTILKVADDALAQVTASDHTAVPQSNLSVEALNATVQTTGQLLDDQRPHLSNVIQKLVALVRSKSDKKSRLLTELQNQGSVHMALKRTGRIIWRLMNVVSQQGYVSGRHLLILLIQKEERARVSKKLQQRFRDLTHTTQWLMRHVRHTKTSTKYLVAGIVIAIVTLVGGISLIARSQAKAAEERTYQEKLASIEDIMERAESALIYKDENQARSLYVNAQTLIESLPTDTTEREERFTQLDLDLNAALNEIRHLTIIPNPPLLADLSTITDGVFGNGMVSISGTIFVAGSDGRVYQLNREEKQFDVAVTTSNTDAHSPLAISEEDGRTYVLNTNGQVYRISFEDKSFEPLTISDDRWVDLKAYANRLYLLQPKSQTDETQIMRFEIQESQTSSSTAWITSRIESLENAVSMSIDGNVYVLMSDGSVSRFANGKEENWKVGVVEPRLTQTTKIWTGPESKYVYILEPSTQRLVVFEKETGNFVIQYRSDAFEDLTDVVVDEEGYTIYLLAGSQLYSIAPSHLK